MRRIYIAYYSQPQPQQQQIIIHKHTQKQWKRLQCYYIRIFKEYEICQQNTHTRGKENKEKENDVNIKQKVEK